MIDTSKLLASISWGALIYYLKAFAYSLTSKEIWEEKVISFLKKHKKAIILFFAAILIVLNLYQLRVRHIENEMRMDIRERLGTFCEKYQKLQDDPTNKKIEELYSDSWTYYEKVYTWYFYCNEHYFLRNDDDVLATWMCFGQTAEEMKYIFADFLKTEDPSSFLENVKEEHIKTLQNGISYLDEENHHYILFDSYNKRILKNEK